MQKGLEGDTYRAWIVTTTPLLKSRLKLRLTWMHATKLCIPGASGCVQRRLEAVTLVFQGQSLHRTKTLRKYLLPDMGWLERFCPRGLGSVWSVGLHQESSTQANVLVSFGTKLCIPGASGCVQRRLEAVTLVFQGHCLVPRNVARKPFLYWRTTCHRPGRQHFVSGLNPAKLACKYYGRLITAQLW